MGRRLLSSGTFVVGTFLIGTFLTAATANADITRTSDGHPDLTGTFNVATLTPLQRPVEFGDNLYLSRQEAQRITEAEAETIAARSAISDPDREAPPEGGDGSAGAAGNVGGYNAFWIDRGDDTFEVDGKFRTSIITEPVNGRRPGLVPAAQQKLTARAASFRRPNSGTAWWLDQAGPGPYDNMEQRPLPERCILGFGPVAGPPIVPTLYNNVKRIVQTSEHIMILAEMVHDARIVRMNKPHRPDSMRTWLGDSIGQWDGDTLVVDTTNFNDSPALRGASRGLHVIERFERVDADTLHYSFTVSDPNVWQTSWSGEYPWPQTGDKVFEYACHEGNYALGNIMRGARILERDIEGSAASGGEE